MTDIEIQILDEIFNGCGEMIEMLPLERRGEYLANVLVKLLARERELTEYYKKIIQVSQCA